MRIKLKKICQPGQDPKASGIRGRGRRALQRNRSAGQHRQRDDIRRSLRIGDYSQEAR